MNKELKEKKKYNKVFEEFTNEENERKSNKELYDRIYGYYKTKTLDKNFSINMERITLHKNIGTHKGFRTNADLNMLFIIITLFISSILQAFSSIMQSQSGSIFSCLVVFGLFVYFVIDFYRAKWQYKEFVYHMCLHALDDLEKENISQLI